MCGSAAGKSKTVINAPPKSEEELSILRNQNTLLELQLQEVKRQNDALAEVFPQQKELLAAQTQAALGQVKLFQEASGLLEETPTQTKIREASEEQTLAVLEGRAPRLAPDQERHIDELISAEREAGQREITRFVGELAGERGLRARTDSPIAREGARAAGELETGLRSTAARAKLDFGQANQVFAESTRQFQEGLRQEAFRNRLAMLGSTPGPSLPLFGTVNPTAALSATTGALNSLAGERLARASTTTRTHKFFTTADLVNRSFDVLQAAAGGLSRNPSFSSARLKRNILPLDQDEYDRALTKVRETPIVRYRYKWERDEARAPHIGPILELSPEEIREDAMRVNLLDYTGLVHAAVKAVDRNVTRLALDLGQKRQTLAID